jgi:hypothetical protein
MQQHYFKKLDSAIIKHYIPLKVATFSQLFFAAKIILYYIFYGKIILQQNPLSHILHSLTGYNLYHNLTTMGMNLYYFYGFLLTFPFSKSTGITVFYLYLP